MDGVVNLAVQPGTGVTNPIGKIRPESVGSAYTSITTASGRIKVTQDYHPSPLTPNLYEVLVTMENIGATPMGDVRYRRVMDWDIPPTTFNEWSEIHVGTSSALVRATSDGFMFGNPLGSPGPFVGVPPTTLFAGSPDYFGGPDDQGALFDFKFGSLAPGEKKSFRIFYGAAANRTAALAAIVAVGGTTISDIELSPEEATNQIGEPHQLEATVEEDGEPVVGTTVTFSVVSGPNTGPLGTAATSASGIATLSYTSSLTGTDVIEASYVTGSGATVLSNRVRKTWTRPLDADLQLVSKLDSADPVLHGDTFSYTITVRNNGPAARRPGRS